MRFDFSQTDLKEALYDYCVKKGFMDHNDSLTVCEHHTTITELSSYTNGFRVSFYAAKRKTSDDTDTKAKKK